MTDVVTWHSKHSYPQWPLPLPLSQEDSNLRHLSSSPSSQDPTPGLWYSFLLLHFSHRDFHLQGSLPLQQLEDRVWSYVWQVISRESRQQRDQILEGGGTKSLEGLGAEKRVCSC